MNMIHAQVQHQQYGSGKVIEQTEKIIAVQFCDKYGIKKFLYPLAFEKYLVLCNPVLQEQVDGELRQIREQIETERRQREEENEKRREEERCALLEQKRTTAKKRSSAKKC